MKKFLLSFAALLAAGSASAEWGVVGAFNGWDVSAYTVMTESEEGVYTVTFPELTGEFKFAADKNWDVNLGASNWDQITGNGTVRVTSFGANFNAPEKLENVTITLDVNKNLVTYSGLATDMDVPSLTDPIIVEGIFLIGDPAGGFSTTEGIEGTKEGGDVYSWTKYLYPDQYFSFTTALVSNMEDPWGYLNAHRYGVMPTGDADYVSGNVVAEDGSEFALCYPMKGDMSWTVNELGYYTLKLDTKNLTLTCENNISWGVVGDFNSWDNDVEMVKNEDGNWEATIENLEGAFKFRANKNWDISLGNPVDIALNEDYTCYLNGDNFKATQKFDKILLVLDMHTMTLSTMLPTGISGVEAENNTPVYYNLQGIRVENPVEGLFIRVTSAGSSKVRL